MADECLWAMPDVDSLDYTIKEYMSYIEHMKACAERINENGMFHVIRLKGSFTNDKRQEFFYIKNH